MTPDASTDDRESRQRAQAAAFDAIGARYADIRVALSPTTWLTTICV